MFILLLSLKLFCHPFLQVYMLFYFLSLSTCPEKDSKYISFLFQWCVQENSTVSDFKLSVLFLDIFLKILSLFTFFYRTTSQVSSSSVRKLFCIHCQKGGLILPNNSAFFLFQQVIFFTISMWLQISVSYSPSAFQTLPKFLYLLDFVVCNPQLASCTISLVNSTEK